MEFRFIVGVDMSKEWFHFCLKDKTLEVLWEGKVDNTPAAIDEFMSQLCAHQQVDHLSDLILVMEHTGIYVQHLLRSWLTKGVRLALTPAVQISEQLGGPLGWEEKADFLDARRIAEYGVRFADKLKLWQAKSATLEALQRFHRQRERLLQALKLLEVPLNESQAFDTPQITQALMANQQASIRALKEDLKGLERRLEQLIEQDEYLADLFNLITSVEGVGPVTAREIIIATGAFTIFEPNQAKAFARYVGVVPLKRESGKAYKKRKRTSKRAHKKLKTLLTMGATSLINKDSELAQYYARKIQEGKPHFCVLNAMRNKLILRVFAVVRNQVMYQKNLNYSL